MVYRRWYNRTLAIQRIAPQLNKPTLGINIIMFSKTAYKYLFLNNTLHLLFFKKLLFLGYRITCNNVTIFSDCHKYWMSGNFRLIFKKMCFGIVGDSYLNSLLKVEVIVWFEIWISRRAVVSLILQLNRRASQLVVSSGSYSLFLLGRLLIVTQIEL